MFLKTVFCFLALLISYAISSGDEIRFPPDVQAALEKAGANRAELEKVLLQYDRLGDTLKFQAACFLIANMEGHSYVTYRLADSAGIEIDFSNTDYPNYDSLLKAWEVIEKVHPDLDFKKKETVDDAKAIGTEYLIGNIDYAFQGWREKRWAKNLSFENFCEYVLPYRGSNEPLEDWRQYFFDKYSGIDTFMTDPSDPIEAARIINKDVMTYFAFDPRYYYHPTDQGLSEMLTTHLGRCEDMTNITIYAMRANGLAVTSDYTPFWANSGNNHAWNAIVTPDGKAIPFMGAEANPGEYSLANKLAKVYRKMYSKQTSNLIFQPRKQQGVPAWLGGKSYKDVTSEYVEVADVTIELTKPIPDSVDIAYICVFNDGQWRPIHWARINDGQATFTDMGTGIAYLPAFYISEDSLQPAGPPFILSDSGEIKSIHPLPAFSSMRIDLYSTTARTQAPSTDGIQVSSLTAGAGYEVFYWEDGWKSIWKGIATDEPIHLNDPPRPGLYWLVADDSNHDERIFIIDEGGQQVWW
jgi:hypothetical protein